MTNCLLTNDVGMVSYLYCRKKEKKRKRGGGRKIKAYAFKPGWQGLIEIEDTQKAKEDFVGGSLEEIKITDGFIAICNENAFIENLETTAVLLGEGDATDEAFDTRGINFVVQGACFVCRCDNDGIFIPITDEDVRVIKHYLKAVGRICDGAVQIE